MRLDTRTCVLIPMAVALNVATGWLAATLKLPLYLDSLGTILAACLAGPWVGALTGCISDTICAATQNFIWLRYLPCAMLIGACVGWIARHGAMRTPLSAGISGGCVGVLAALLAAPITAYGGGASGSGMDIVVAIVKSAGFTTTQACFAQSLLIDPLDKALSFWIIQMLLAALPAVWRESFPQGAHLRDIKAWSLPHLISTRQASSGYRPQTYAVSEIELYQPGTSFWHRVSPGTKILLVLAALAGAFYLPTTLMLPAQAAVPCAILPHYPLLIAALFFSA